jgi:hypothetical protein
MREATVHYSFVERNSGRLRRKKDGGSMGRNAT